MIKSKKKTTKMKIDKDLVKLDRESYSKLKEMFSSSDKENHTVAFGILKNLDMKVNLPYVLLLHKFFKESIPEGWKDLVPEINKALKAVNEPKLDSITYITIESIVSKSYADPELQLVLDEFLNDMKERITKWGFEFLGKSRYKLALTIQD